MVAGVLKPLADLMNEQMMFLDQALRRLGELLGVSFRYAKVNELDLVAQLETRHLRARLLQDAQGRSYVQLAQRQGSTTSGALTLQMHQDHRPVYIWQAKYIWASNTHRILRLLEGMDKTTPALTLE